MRRSFVPTACLFLGLAGCSGSLDSIDSQLATRVAPIYPEQARQQGIEGSVLLEFDINEQGEPVNIKVAESEPRGVFDAAAIAAVEQWRYVPKLRYGKPVPVKDAEAALSFTIGETAPALSEP